MALLLMATRALSSVLSGYLFNRFCPPAVDVEDVLTYIQNNDYQFCQRRVGSDGVVKFFHSKPAPSRTLPLPVQPDVVQATPMVTPLVAPRLSSGTVSPGPSPDMVFALLFLVLSIAMLFGISLAIRIRHYVKKTGGRIGVNTQIRTYKSWMVRCRGYLPQDVTSIGKLPTAVWVVKKKRQTQDVVAHSTQLAHKGILPSSARSVLLTTYFALNIGMYKWFHSLGVQRMYTLPFLGEVPHTVVPYHSFCTISSSGLKTCNAILGSLTNRQISGWRGPIKITIAPFKQGEKMAAWQSKTERRLENGQGTVRVIKAFRKADAKINKKETEIEQLTSQNTDLKERCLNLFNQLKLSNASKKVFSSVAENMGKASKLLSARVTELADANKKLTGLITALKHKALQHIAAKDAEISRLKSVIKGLEEQRDKHHADLAQLKEEIPSTSTQLGTSKTEVEAYKANTDKYMAEPKARQKAVTQKDLDLFRLQKGIGATSAPQAPAATTVSSRNPAEVEMRREVCKGCIEKEGAKFNRKVDNMVSALSAIRGQVAKCLLDKEIRDGNTLGKMLEVVVEKSPASIQNTLVDISHYAHENDQRLREHVDSQLLKMAQVLEMSKFGERKVAQGSVTAERDGYNKEDEDDQGSQGKRDESSDNAAKDRGQEDQGHENKGSEDVDAKDQDDTGKDAPQENVEGQDLEDEDGAGKAAQEQVGEEGKVVVEDRPVEEKLQEEKMENQAPNVEDHSVEGHEAEKATDAIDHGDKDDKDDEDDSEHTDAAKDAGAADGQGPKKTRPRRRKRGLKKSAKPAQISPSTPTSPVVTPVVAPIIPVYNVIPPAHVVEHDNDVAKALSDATSGSLQDSKWSQVALKSKSVPAPRQTQPPATKPQTPQPSQKPDDSETKTASSSPAIKAMQESKWASPAATPSPPPKPAKKQSSMMDSRWAK